MARFDDRLSLDRIDAVPRLDLRNSAPAMPKCVVVDSAYDWDGDRKPAIAWEDLVIYEAHVKGMTALHPDVPRRIRGKFAALASPAVIAALDLARRERG